MIRRRMTVKRVDPWSILKLGLVLNIAGAAILVITGVVIWSVIRRLQIIERVCEQAQSLLGFESCNVDGVEIMRTGLLLAGLLVVVVTGVMVFAAFLYNLIADLTGGIEVSMLDHSGQMRTASGGVQVSPELTGPVGDTQPGRRPASSTGAPSTGGVGAGAVGAGAIGAGAGVAASSIGGQSGPVMASSPDPTIASASARPNTAVPLLDDDTMPPVVRESSVTHDPVAADSDTGPPPYGAGDEARDGTPEAEAPTGDVPWPERPAADDDAPRPAVRGRAAAAGARIRDAADRTGSALSDVAHRAGAALTDATAGEAAARAQRAHAEQQSLDELSKGGARGADQPGRRGAGEDGRARDPSFRRDGRSSAGRDGSSTSEPASPQEAAAARVKARKASEPVLPPRGSDGKFVPKEDREAAAGNGASTETPRELFGQHPRQAES